MTPEELAKIHARCFEMPRPWTAAEFEDLLNNPLVFLVTSANGFALGRTIGPETELLTIAVDPDAQAKGQGRRILAEFIESAKAQSVQEIFLEVAENNHAAISLYNACGFKRIGKRRNYYQAKSGGNVAAIVMKKPING